METKGLVFVFTHQSTIGCGQSEGEAITLGEAVLCCQGNTQGSAGLSCQPQKFPAAGEWKLLLYRELYLYMLTSGVIYGILFNGKNKFWRRACNIRKQTSLVNLQTLVCLSLEKNTER